MQALPLSLVPPVESLVQDDSLIFDLTVFCQDEIILTISFAQH